MWGKNILLSLANADKHRLSVPFPAQRGRFSFPPLLPPLFFLLPSAAHNSEQYMMAALKHWSGFRAGQDSSPVHFVYNIALISPLPLPVVEKNASTPFLFFKQEAESFRVSPSLLNPPIYQLLPFFFLSF